LNLSRHEVANRLTPFFSRKTKQSFSSALSQSLLLASTLRARKARTQKLRWQPANTNRAILCPQKNPSAQSTQKRTI